MNKCIRAGVVAFAVLGAFAAYVADGANAQETKQAKNVILFIGDGMGFNSDLIGSYWRTGKAWGLPYQQFPVKFGSATFSVKPDYKEDIQGYVPKQIWRDAKGVQEKGHAETRVTDSAASGTAINSGNKTLDGHINYSKHDRRLQNFADLNYEAGRSVGVVTAVQISHATPAAASAHNVNRNNYEEISKEQINDSKLSVLFGAGNPEYTNGRKIDKKPEELNYQFVGGRETWEAVSKDEGYKGWKFIDEKSEFAELAAATPDSGAELPKRVLGVGRAEGDLLPVDGNADEEGLALVVDKYSQKTIDATPTLTQMTLGALNVLAQNESGFYLMVEGGAIDHANHGNNAQSSVLEHAGFSKAIEAAIAWVEKYSSWDETLIIVTADHETGELWGEGTYDDVNENGKFDDEDEFYDFEPIAPSKIGVVPSVQYLTSGHTNGLVPFYAKGAGCEKAKDFVRGNDEKAGEIWDFSGDYIYNSDVFNVMKAASGLK
ncbi:MAG: alkaline phosphatase [Thermoguttaceae bacterium]|nr:alkaline phosphatase [Thermoguttaceae bacterium]